VGLDVLDRTWRPRLSLNGDGLGWGDMSGAAGWTCDTTGPCSRVKERNRDRESYWKAAGVGLADEARSDAIPEAAGGQHGHGAARQHDVIYRYVQLLLHPRATPISVDGLLPTMTCGGPFPCTASNVFYRGYKSTLAKMAHHLRVCQETGPYPQSRQN
jgi:hypothetical protein